ncbi:bifunctional folylpolyglutamate synthase/dihydrofolate synthase [Calderihabitans maritimus]|uniref:Dihydrofolate synthase/folylpolyglutamate synthase n=1 Tax=Calderihabitans maritimus TaxID=1246530 RepID=A0A1Z5HVF9_9FIRM|nr:folylpolyglutamate synthase/dihydrofolate synthase family protein [Calderihabitans maritimus]GAW93315.1 bifunctional folylpolyglutamate synthase/ dihydrofolate synthase [Calderihabitans maritimus]
MNYRESLEYLQHLTKFGFNFGLDRIKHLLYMLGDPHKSLRVIHVGGTNGKGSTVAMIAKVLEEEGYRVGTFTSPHLHSYCERVQINGVQIAPERFAEIITRLRPLLDRMVVEGHEHPTEFEVITALGFLYFFEEKVDFVVLEVGLGGAIDSTNVVVPLVSVITNVGMDHMDYLGSTIEEIARVKAGIIKEKGYVVTAAENKEALKVISDVCREKEARLIRVGKEVTLEEIECNLTGQRFHVRGMRQEYRDLFIPLLGRHQLTNAATAIAALEALGFHHIVISERAIKSGLAKTSWPARLEILSRTPLILIDAAHNVDGALSLRRALTELFPYRRLILVMGMLADKEREKVIGLLAPLAQAVVVTRPNSPRAGDWEYLAEEVKKIVRDVYMFPSITEAVDRALQLALPEDLICITGSFYMVAEAREYLLRNLGKGSNIRL